MRSSLSRIILSIGTGIVIGYCWQRGLAANESLPMQTQGALIANYISEHQLGSMIKQTLMNAFMQVNGAFLDHGMKQTLKGFYFYNNYFDKKQIEKGQFTKQYCLFIPKNALCGHPGIQHGGATATLIDQNCGMLAMLYSRQLVATSELAVKYLKPIHQGSLYVLTNEVIGRDGRKVWVQASITDIRSKQVVAEGNVLMMTVKWQHRMAKVFSVLFGKKEEGSEIHQGDQVAKLLDNK